MICQILNCNNLEFLMIQIKIMLGKWLQIMLVVGFSKFPFIDFEIRLMTEEEINEHNKFMTFL